VNEHNWFPDDPGMQLPRTRAEIARENRAQHAIVVADSDPREPGISRKFEMCDVCGRIGAQLREPCALPIDLIRNAMDF
jgi:hypothetical protein